ncbi:hypothetical protein ABWH96_18080 [Marivirga tractuosa]|uniref:hypothetical protein n=1 Tax=Marivirga tractuosa TaxID=1006 RepID=UPI0035CF4F74
MESIKKLYRNYFSAILFGMLATLLCFNSSLNAQNFNPKNEELLDDIAFISSVENFEKHNQWNRLVRKLERKSNADAEYFLEYLFYKTHQKLLKEYNKGTTFTNLMEDGSYDCVSASITYSVLLKYFDIEHSIIETDYHVFIIAEANGKEVIFETTDPRNGLVSDSEEIKEFKADFLPKLNSAQLNQNESLGSSVYGQPNSKTIYKEISLRELSALQYFNQGLIAMHNKDYKLASRRLQQALNLYDSERINMLFKIVAP